MALKEFHLSKNTKQIPIKNKLITLIVVYSYFSTTVKLHLDPLFLYVVSYGKSVTFIWWCNNWQNKSRNVLSNQTSEYKMRVCNIYEWIQSDLSYTYFLLLSWTYSVLVVSFQTHVFCKLNVALKILTHTYCCISQPPKFYHFGTCFDQNH